MVACCCCPGVVVLHETLCRDKDVFGREKHKQMFGVIEEILWIRLWWDGYMTVAGEILASNCKKPLLHNVWNPKVSWWGGLPTVRSQHSGHAGGFQQFVARQAANGTCAKATRLNQGCWTWQSSVSLKLKPGLESLYPVFKDASIKRFVPQLGNKTAQTLCALCTASFWLEVKDPSQSQKILVGTQQHLIKATRF